MEVNTPFIRSCEGFLQYPKNLIQHDVLNHNIEAYYERLKSQKKDLFNEKQGQAAVDFLDLNGGNVEFSQKCIVNLRDLKLLLREALNPENKDPQCRFM